MRSLKQGEKLLLRDGGGREVRSTQALKQHRTISRISPDLQQERGPLEGRTNLGIVRGGAKGVDKVLGGWRRIAHGERLHDGGRLR